MMSKLDRYIVGELVGPFLFGIAVVILLFEGSLLFPLINVIVEKHVPLMQVARLLLLKVPWLVVWAAPVAMLFASALAVNRMGRDNEITCMRAAGLSLRRIFAPIMAAGLAVSVLSFLVGERVVPVAERAAARIEATIWMTQSMPEIEPDIFFRTENLCFYVGAVQRKVGSRDVQVQNVLIYTLPDGSTPFPQLITAKYGESRGLQWVFRDGWIITLDAKGMAKSQLGFTVHHKNLQHAVQDLWAGQQQSQAMTLRELKQQMEQFSHGGLPVSSMAVDYHLRLSIPLSCLIFALVSAPLSLRFAKAGGFAGLLLSVVLGFLYYNTIFLGKILGTQEVLPAALAGWLQNILFGAIGLFLILRGE
jgi:lipopolysaccharide export system permease protein